MDSHIWHCIFEKRLVAIFNLNALKDFLYGLVRKIVSLRISRQQPRVADVEIYDVKFLALNDAW